MATIGSGNPKLYAELSASQVGASGTKRTVRVTMRCRVDGNTNPNYASSFGYAADYRVVANGNGTWALGSWQTLKGTEWWSSTNSLRTFTQDITFDVGTTSSKSVKVGFDVDSKISNDWDGSAHIDFTVGSTNTAPTMNGSVTIRDTNSSGAVLTGIIPENVSTLYLSWPAGSDKEQGASGLKYGVNQIVNGGGASTVVYPTTNLYAAINIGTGNEGEKRKYYVDCRDNSDVLSTNRANSVEVTKNIFTTDALNSINSISYDSENITFTYSGAKNSNGNTTFTRVLSCDGLTVYNPTLASSPATVSIWRSGTVPSGAYIKFDDIKEKLKNSTYTGTLNFTLRTTNAYGTAKSSSKVVNVDLRTKPNPATNQEISTTASESTIYKKVAFANNYYFLPDGSGVARVKWSAGSGKLGETISYELYVAYGSGSWQKLADLSSGTLYYNHVITKQTISQQFKYMIRTKTSYGYYEDAVTPAQTLHYYNAPSISVKPVIRTETTAEIPLTVKTSSSIPNIGTVGTWSGQGSGNLTAAQTEQKINVTGLTGAGTYTITIVYNDNTGFSSNQTRAVAIGANLPIMFLNKYGLGVGGLKADSSFPLVVSGVTKISTLNNILTIGSRNNSFCHFESSTSPFYFNKNMYVNGEIYAGSSYNKKVYHEGNKPTPSDIGALDVAGAGKMTGTLNVNAGNGINFNNDDKITYNDSANAFYFTADGAVSKSKVDAGSFAMNGTDLISISETGQQRTVRFANGIQITTDWWHTGWMAINKAWGSMFYSEHTTPANFQLPFSIPPTVTYSARYRDDPYLVWAAGGAAPTTTSPGSVSLCRATTHEDNFVVMYTAIGRWK